MANIDQDTFNSSYRPNVSQDDFNSRFSPEAQSSVSRLPFDDQSPSLVDPSDTIKDIHQEFIKKGPYSGPVSDQLFQQGSVGRIMSAFGQGFKDSWGSDDSSLYKGELDKEAKEKDTGLLTALRNSLMKPTSAALDAISKTPFALGAGIAGATGQAGEELSKESEALKEGSPDWAFDTVGGKIHLDPGHLLATPLDYSSEILKGVASGGLMEGGVLGHAATVDHVQQIMDARSKGVIGEGEAGFFKVTKPTPEDIQGRESAAQEAGTWTPKFKEGAVTSLEDHVPTVPELARQIDPDTFKKADDLGDLKENLQLSLQDQRTKYNQEIELGTSPDHPKMIDRMNGILDLQERIQKSDEGIRDLIPDVADAKNRAQELLESQTPEGDQYRNFVQAQAFERALQVEPLKAKAEETLRLANDLKDANEPETPADSKPKTGLKSTDIVKPEKTPEVTVTPEAISGKVREAPRAQFERDLKTINQDIPEVSEGFTRLWRGNRPGEVGQNPVFTNDAAGIALPFRKVYGGDLSYIDIPTSDLSKYENKAGAVPGAEFTLPSDLAKKANIASLKKVQGTGEKTSLSVNQRLQVDSVIQGWKTEVGDVPQEEVLKTEQQLSEASRLIKDNPSVAEKVAMGDTVVPEGYDVHPEAVLKMMKKQAEDAWDYKLGLKLADTRLAGEARTMGQRLNLLRGMYDIDPVGIIQDLNDTMKEQGKKVIDKITKDIKASVDAAINDFKPDMEAFLRSIECD